MQKTRSSYEVTASRYFHLNLVRFTTFLWLDPSLGPIFQGAGPLICAFLIFLVTLGTSEYINMTNKFLKGLETATATLPKCYWKALPAILTPP